LVIEERLLAKTLTVFIKMLNITQQRMCRIYGLDYCHQVLQTPEVKGYVINFYDS